MPGCFRTIPFPLLRLVAPARFLTGRRSDFFVLFRSAA
jgi:hypothetical protein